MFVLISLTHFQGQGRQEEDYVGLHFVIGIPAQTVSASCFLSLFSLVSEERPTLPTKILSSDLGLIQKYPFLSCCCLLCIGYKLRLKQRLTAQAVLWFEVLPFSDSCLETVLFWVCLKKILFPPDLGLFKKKSYSPPHPLQKYPMAVVGTAGRGLIIYQLENQPQEFKRMESPLKYQVTFSHAGGLMEGKHACVLACVGVHVLLIKCFEL